MEDRFIRGAEESNGGGRILIGPRIDGRPSLLDFVLTGEKEKVTESMGSNLPVGWMRFSNSARLYPTPAPNKLELYLPVARTFPRNVAFE